MTSRMIIECSSCHARYQYDEARFDGKASKKIKCAKCATVFEIHNPGAEPAPGEAVAETPKKTLQGEQTRAAKPKQARPDEDEQDPEPRDIPTDLQMPAGRRLSLAIIDGTGAGNVFRISKPSVTVGRSGADFVIDDTEASRQHASVEVRDTLYTLNDLQSKNGTLVDGQRIEGPVELQDKSEFVIGTTTLMLIVTQE